MARARIEDVFSRIFEGEDDTFIQKKLQEMLFDGADGRLVFEHKFSHDGKDYEAHFEQDNDNNWLWKVAIDHGQRCFTGIGFGTSKDEEVARADLARLVDSILPGESARLPKP
jgi:hypothetical protein